MKIEQERGISVTSSVMTFEHRRAALQPARHAGPRGLLRRHLPHADRGRFAPSWCIDAAKGIESQTRKLFEVCRLRDIPIITFINKVDREGRDPFELLDEIQDELAARHLADASGRSAWAGCFEGCYDVHDEQVPDLAGTTVAAAHNRCRHAPASTIRKLDEMVQGHRRARAPRAKPWNWPSAAMPTFDRDLYREGHLTPVVFGSALHEFSASSRCSI